MPSQESFLEKRAGNGWLYGLDDEASRVFAVDKTPQLTGKAPALISTLGELQRFECPDIECGAVFSYCRVSCSHFVSPKFCPTCGGPMDNTDEDDALPRRFDELMYRGAFCEAYYIHLAASGAPSVNMPVKYADEAARAFSAYREKYDLGASEMDVLCGNVYDSQNRLVARISYNGRVWDPDGNPVE